MIDFDQSRARILQLTKFYINILKRDNTWVIMIVGVADERISCQNWIKGNVGEHFNETDLAAERAARICKLSDSRLWSLHTAVPNKAVLRLTHEKKRVQSV